MDARVAASGRLRRPPPNHRELVAGTARNGVGEAGAPYGLISTAIHELACSMVRKHPMTYEAGAHFVGNVRDLHSVRLV